MAAKKKKKKYRGFWIFVKVQFVLSLLVLGGLGYYVLGGYASEVSSIHKEADRYGIPRRRRSGDTAQALCMRRTAV